MPPVKAGTLGELASALGLDPGSLVQTVASFGNQMISPLAPFLVSDLHLARADVGLLVTAAATVTSGPGSVPTVRQEHHVGDDLAEEVERLRERDNRYP